MLVFVVCQRPAIYTASALRQLDRVVGIVAPPADQCHSSFVAVAVIPEPTVRVVLGAIQAKVQPHSERTYLSRLCII